MSEEQTQEQQAGQSFPGEDTQSEQQAPQEPEQEGPWMVMLTEPGMVFSIFKAGFKLQVDADNWIKDNIGRDQKLVSMRMGNAFQARFVARQCEL